MVSLGDFLTPFDVIAAFNEAGGKRQFDKAEAMARQLAPLDQLNVIDSLRAAESRLNLKHRRRNP